MDKIFKQAFTLIELLTVILIVGVISSLIIVGMNNSLKSANFAKAQAFANSIKNTAGLNLVAEWRFDEGSGTAVADSWGYGNNRTLTCPAGNCWESGTDCVYKTCLYLPGNDISYVQVAHTTSLSFGDASIAYWVYNGAGAASYPTMFNKHAQSSSAGYWWVYTYATNESTIYWQYHPSDGTTATVNWANVFPNNVWSYLTFIYNDTAKIVELYIDGISKGIKTTTNSTPVTSATLFIGSYQGSTASSYSFTGRFDDFRLYSSIVTASHIKQQYYIGMNRLLDKGEITMEDYNNRMINFKNNLAVNK